MTNKQLWDLMAKHMVRMEDGTTKTMAAITEELAKRQEIQKKLLSLK